MRIERGVGVLGAVVFVVAALAAAWAIFAVGILKGSNPAATEVAVRHRCLEQLKRIGEHLGMMKAKGELRLVSGEAFLLQAVDRMSDEELEAFICPSDESRRIYEPGTAAFVKRYRDPEFRPEDLSELTSYAGPNFDDYPPFDADELRIWACDRCVDGDLAHGGICVLWSDGTVEFLTMRKLEGHRPQDGFIIVGPNSPDRWLKKMCGKP
jgi:hypothetical protein